MISLFPMKLFYILLAVCSQIQAQNSIGSRCTHNLQCGTGAFCYENICRKDGCTISTQCSETETCEYGHVNGRFKPACFPSKKIGKTDDFCPGGGAVVMGFDGSLSTCDFTKGCSLGQVCNPQNGVCCTKLRTCPKPAKTMLNHLTGQPIMCQYKFGSQAPCPSSGYCELKTGFCCQKTDTGPSSVVTIPKGEKPIVSQVCTLSEGCSGGAACNCPTSFICKCECLSEFGYSIASDGKSCQRIRRRLKEKCKSDEECSTAFSECATSGCRCKKGFQRDGDGSCKPINYKCPGNRTPIMKNEKPVVCHRRAVFSRLKVNITDGEFKEIMANVTALEEWNNRKETDSCPEDHYCVATFDDATRPGFYQGFCCPTPSDVRPVCPVGEAHESSYYPDFGCNNCPSHYYCHRDGIVTEKAICCPKPCTALDDIYYNGQCYSTAFYGDSCSINAQCTSKPSFSTVDFEQAPLECRRGICQCPSGYSHASGQCKRVTCTVGLRGEPSTDRNNELLTCKRSSDCSQGQLCDMTHGVCCKGNNRCPSNYEETGEQCTAGHCINPSHLCYTTNAFKKARICCVSV